MKTQRTKIDWILSSIIILATVAVIAATGTRISAASDIAPQSFAQATQLRQSGPTVPPGRGGPGSLKGQTAQVKVLCNGKTNTECCQGISYCACLYSPMPAKGDENKPLSCNSSPPKN
jgi:hypothetical protein